MYNKFWINAIIAFIERNRINEENNLGNINDRIFNHSTFSAHTGLTSSSPAEGEDITGDVYEIVLEFNSRIESTSTWKNNRGEVFDETE